MPIWPDRPSAIQRLLSQTYCLHHNLTFLGQTTFQITLEDYIVNPTRRSYHWRTYACHSKDDKHPQVYSSVDNTLDWRISHAGLAIIALHKSFQKLSFKLHQIKITGSRILFIRSGIRTRLDCSTTATNEGQPAPETYTSSPYCCDIYSLLNNLCPKVKFFGYWSHETEAVGDVAQ